MGLDTYSGLRCLTLAEEREGYATLSPVDIQKQIKSDPDPVAPVSPEEYLSDNEDDSPFEQEQVQYIHIHI